jgi:two-component system, chemotaxis family, protein-glutamate methylesterase/glutaminase
MPVADGLEATKEIMMRAPTPILIVSAVSRRDVDLSLSATQAGALMALPSPSTRVAALRGDAAELRAWPRDGPGQGGAPLVRELARSPRCRPAAARAGCCRPRCHRRIDRRTCRVAPHTHGPAADAAGAAAGGAAHRARLHRPASPTGSAAACTAGQARRIRRAAARRCRLRRPRRCAPRRLAGPASAARDAPPIGGFRPSATHLFESPAAVVR